MRRLLLLSWLLCCGGPAAAGSTVYQCRASNGQLTYQDTPCSKTQEQRVLALPDLPRTPALSAPAPTDRITPPDSEAAPAPPPEQPVAPVPRMYGCVRATDGKSYVSQNGDAAPYLAPYGVLGAGQLPLPEAYGPTQGGAGISAPESNHGRVTAGLVADNYVWVQDQCRELSPQETCAALREDFDANAHALNKAFKSDRPPLEQRERELRAQLRGC
jgi:hypothetical protein